MYVQVDVYAQVDVYVKVVVYVQVDSVLNDDIRCRRYEKQSFVKPLIDETRVKV